MIFRALLWFLTLAALAIGLSLAVRHNDGYALFVLPPWRAEVSLNLLVLLLLSAFVLAYLLLRAVTNVLRLPRKVREFRARRARDKAEAALGDAMRLSLEGRYGHALKSAETAWEAGHAPGLAALLALRAAHAMRDGSRANLWRERVASRDDEIRVARLMTEAEIATETRRFDDAKNALESLTASGGRHIAALRLALRARQSAGEWREVVQLTRQLEKHKAMTPEQAAPILLRAHREVLDGLRQDAPRLLRYWRDLPAAERLEPRMALAGASALAAAGDCIEAARIVEDALDERWDSSLIAAYAGCEGGDVLARIAHAEKWLTQHPKDARLLFALGRLCRQKQLWGKAESYLEASLAIEPSRAAYIELAQLLDQLERPEEAGRHYRTAALCTCPEGGCTRFRKTVR
ncbi:MAG: heme biosynthesis protein HemY [Candidatus Nitricoxidivorans perseverans]|uniref:Heme biosynthesis protein HemY n=1 Tax=Candidatus Nitricoxidivorans perseverans TaxID=2975601 RepID=A0AA49IYF4_9PROT|nr:MAG: heme biosynthesis protein HemY [Candidatus Nitricoxidivorans perseverans]